MTAEQVLAKFRLEHRRKCLRGLQQLHCALLTAPTLDPQPSQKYANNGPGIHTAFAPFYPKLPPPCTSLTLRSASLRCGVLLNFRWVAVWWRKAGYHE